MVTEAAHRLENEETRSHERKLALEIRSRRFGFAVIQGTDLLDWGVRTFPFGVAGAEVAIGRLAVLLKLYAPSTVFARRTRRVRGESSENAAHIFRTIRGELKRRSVRFEVLARADVREYFVGRGHHNKQEIATVISDRFSQLKSRLPPARKKWEPERQIFAVFDAIATAVVCNAETWPRKPPNPE